LIGRLPFFYGWVILGCLCCAGFARQGPAVATLSIFVEPLTREFGWSRAALSGAVSLGGVLAALASPLIGPWVDRHGSRATLSLAVLVTGAAMLLLSLTPSLLVFYLLFCIARMNWAGPFDLGIYAAVNKLVCCPPAVCDFGRHRRADGRPRHDAAGRAAGDAGARLALRLAGDRVADLGCRLSAGVAVHGTSA
jgi:hypothetical protein